MTTGVGSAGHWGATLEIDLDAVAANWRDLAARAAPAICSAVVKADGYGLGAVPIAKRLLGDGVRLFFVAHVSEAMALRPHLPGARIAVLNGLAAGGVDEHIAHDFLAVLNRREDAEIWRLASRQARRKLPAIVHVDTGMNRLGMSADDAIALAHDADWRGSVELAAMMSHLVASEEPDNPVNAEQLGKFRPLRAAFAGTPASLANSSAIFLGTQYHFDIVRPGAALFGINPTPGKANPMRAAARLDAKILQVRRVDTQQSVGYGATWRAKRPSRIATVAVGYADGYLRSIGNRGSVAIDGERVPIVGRVSMDLITIDVTSISEARAMPGATVELIGPTLPVDDVADFAGTNGYEIFTSLGPRYRRLYRGAAA